MSTPLLGAAARIDAERGALIIELPITNPTPTRTGTALNIASTRGPIYTTATILGRQIIINVNAWIKDVQQKDVKKYANPLHEELPTLREGEKEPTGITQLLGTSFEALSVGTRIETTLTKQRGFVLHVGWDNSHYKYTVKLDGNNELVEYHPDFIRRIDAPKNERP